jgi:hypothetical protein
MIEDSMQSLELESLKSSTKTAGPAEPAKAATPAQKNAK